MLQKLGWGHFSTVWLAKDLQYDSFVAIKIQKSAQQYLEAAFDEVEILEQVSTKWKTKEWQESFRSYEKTNEVNSDSCYCIQLLNSFVHFGPNGKHFAMVFEILGVTLLEIIKRYNYKGVPLPLVRIITRQILIGLDYLHRICHIIHTDLKPENVLVCLTKEEVKEIIAQGQFGKAKSLYKYGASPLPGIQSACNGGEVKEEVKKVDYSKGAKEMTEEERKELKKQKKREKKKRLKKKKQEAKAEMNKENDADKDELNEDIREETKTKPNDQPKVITNTMKEKPNVNVGKRRSSDPTIASSLATTKSNWNDEEDLMKFESGFTPDKKLSNNEDSKPYKDR